MSRTKNILFVCTGNICRSPMAEYLMRERLGDHSGWQVQSAGVAAWAGSPASLEAVAALADLGIDLEPHLSQSLDARLVDEMDLIVVMTSAHREAIVQQYPDAREKVYLLHEFGTEGQARDVADPIGMSVNVYRRTRDEIDGALSDLILYLKEHGGLNAVPQEKKTMKIAIGADHGGFELKERLKKRLVEQEYDVDDVGCESTDSVDYPDYAERVARKVSEGSVERGVLICTTGIGMAMTANKFPRVRAALCTNERTAQLSRQHNNANVLAMGASVVSPEEADAILDAWLAAEFESGGRHERRVGKMQACMSSSSDPVALYNADSEIYAAMNGEIKRQRQNIELIASENYASRAVREATGSIMTNKYAEGYPGKRWYHGCEFVDEAERLAIDRARELFGAEHANVQPHSGSQANMAVYFAVMNPGDTLLAMDLAHGGHLTHGYKVNFSGRLYNAVHYGVDPESETINYDEVQKLADEHKPKLICAGASAYSRLIDFKRLRQIADSVGAYLMVDMAHIAGLVAAGCHPNPVPYCEFVTTTTHKTLRGPRGGMVLCQERFAQDINRQVFPGLQGGPLMHVIAAKAVCFYEALQPAFKEYQQQVVCNAQALAEALQNKGLRIVSGGTDNHLMLVDLTPIDVTGKDAAAALDKASITVNKNAIPFDQKSPFVTSGVRLGTPAVTTRGMKQDEMVKIADMIYAILSDIENDKVNKDIHEQVLELTSRFPVP